MNFIFIFFQVIIYFFSVAKPFLQGVEFSNPDLQAFETFFFRFELWQETDSIDLAVSPSMHRRWLVCTCNHRHLIDRRSIGCWDARNTAAILEWSTGSSNSSRNRMPGCCSAYSCSNRRTIHNRNRGITFHKQDLTLPYYWYN